ncbi:MAG TPA: pyridoxal phosphate-dependent aminotransferase [Actinomycetota bacterium]|nr:pyridoxal phosphate-dependent aminotransferase [Actinomycetota bacterium]
MRKGTLAIPERLSRRVGRIGESATLAVDARAKALKAAGEKVIGFGAGEPDFPTPEHIVRAAAEAASNPVFHHYTATGGLPELRTAIARKTERDSGLEVQPEQVLVTNGGKHALFNTFLTLLDDGDEVLIPSPYWVSYPEMVQIAGGRVVDIPTDESTGFKVTIEQLEAAITARTKALLFVSPSNPTGAVYSPAEVAEIGRWVRDRELWVVTDEIYEHLVYGDAVFRSMPVEVPEVGSRCIIINGVAKTYAMTGWRVGWMIGPADVIKGAMNLQSHATSNVSNVAQAAALAAVSGDLTAAFEMREAFDRRRQTMFKMLSEIPDVVCLEPEGAFYAFPSFKGYLGRSIGGAVVNSTLDLAETILDRAKVALVPGEGFGAPGYARLSYALSDEDVAEGVTRIADLLATAR